MDLSILSEFLKATGVIVRKDLRIWIRQPLNIAATVLPPLLFLLVQALGAQAVGRSPVALVVQDSGQEGGRVSAAIRNADVFRLSVVDANAAQALLNKLEVVAVITVPPDFTQRVLAHEPAPINVTVNNLNLDFTNDIRRAVPDAITQYYLAQGDQSPIKVTMREHDLRVRDVQLFQYAVLPTLVLLLTISGLISGGMAAAREWERQTIKELLLSPAPASAIIAGKILAGFVTTFGLGVIVFGVGSALGWVRPEGVYWLNTLVIVALVAMFGSGLGVAVGAALRRVVPVTAISVNLALYLYFLSGGISVLAFEPVWLQQIAAVIPLTYGNHALQMAIFYSSADQFGLDVAVLSGATLLAVAAGVLAVRRQLIA